MNRKTIFSALHNERGTVVIVVALFLITLIGFAALAIDVGHMMVTRNELQNAADAAALATMKKLGDTYSTMTYSAQQSYVAVLSDFAPTAQAVASSNIAAGKSVNINQGVDVILGDWDFNTNTFTPGLTRPDAVRVITRRDGSANGPVPTFFAGVLGLSTIPVSARATAAVSALSHAPENDLPLPVAISKAKFESEYCNTPIRFYPTNDPLSCGGWNVYTESPASAHELSTILKGLTNDTYHSPETVAGETVYNFTGGTLASVFDDMKALFDAKRVLNDGEVDKDNDSATWTTAVPVYDAPDCSNPNGPLTIIGFAAVTITQILEAPAKVIDATVVCDLIVQGAGGGPLPVTIGTLPNLVE
jgi:Flp pilus assembly protein TadG